MCKTKQLEFLREIEKNGNPSKEKKKKNFPEVLEDLNYRAALRLDLPLSKQTLCFIFPFTACYTIL